MTTWPEADKSKLSCRCGYLSNICDGDALSGHRGEYMMNAIPVFGTEDRLPSRIAGLEVESVDQYPDPRLGVMVRYGIPPLIKADAYLYDMGLRDIPEDLNSPEVLQLFEESLRGVTMAAEQGVYLDFEVLGSGYLNLPPESPEPFCLGASFAYRQNPKAHIPVVFPEKEGTINDVGRLVSHMTLRVDRGYINKIRFNDPEDAGEAGFTGFLGFIFEWTQAVQLA